MQNNQPEKTDKSCGCAPEKKPSFKLRDIFKKSAACACGPAGGFLLGHVGCIITPLVLAFSGATAATGAVTGGLSVAIGAAFTMTGLLAWEHFRGTKAGKTERRITYIGSISGVMLSGAFHLAGHGHHNHMSPDDVRCRQFISCPPPAQPVPAADTLVIRPTH